jgi:hypothetical protein
MEAPIKKPKPKKPRKPRKPRKPSTGGTNITINVGTSSSRAPRRARAPAKPKVDPTANQFGFRSPGAGGGGGGGVLPSFAGQGDQFRQVIYTPQGDVSGSIKALEKSIETLSRASGSQYGDGTRPPINFVGNRDDASQAGGNDGPVETTAEKLERMRRLRAGGLNPLASIPEGLSRSELNRRLSEESRTKQAQEQMLGQYEPAEQPPLGS